MNNNCNQSTIFDFLDDETSKKYRPTKSTDWKWSFKDYPKEKNGLKVFSCFACGGGSTMGYKLAGCEVIGDVEIDKRMNDIYVRNHNPKYNYLMDIRDFNSISNEELPDELFNLDILDGSPPCTTFSMVGNREESWGVKKKFKEGQKEQTLDDLSFVFINTIEKLKPKTFIMENVEGLLLGNAWEYVQKIYEKVGSIGYKLKHYLLKGEEMGIPQARHRVFFIGIREDVDYDLDELEMCFNYYPITFREIKDGKGKKATGKALEIIKEMRDGETTMGEAHERLYGRRSWFSVKALRDDEVPSTMVAGHGDAYDYENRSLLSKNDMITIATFPQDYDFINPSVNRISFVCGMSVPPVMTKRVVTRLIEEGVFDYKLGGRNKEKKDERT